MRNIIIKSLLGLIISATAFGGAGTLALKFQDILNITKASAAKSELNQLGKFLDEASHDAAISFGLSKSKEARIGLVMIDGTLTRGANNASLRLAILGGQDSALVTEEVGFALQRILRAEGIKVNDELIEVSRVELRGTGVNNEIGIDSFRTASVNFAGMDASQAAILLDRALLVIKTLDISGVEGVKALGRTAAKVESKYDF